MIKKLNLLCSNILPGHFRSCLTDIGSLQFVETLTEIIYWLTNCGNALP